MGARLIFCITMIIATGCSYNHNETQTIRIDDAVNAGNTMLEKFITIDELIPIKDKNVIFGSYDKVLVRDSLIYIKDEERIVVINKDGMLYSEINHIGMGPGEYSKITDFTIDNQGNIILFCSNEQKLLFYSSKGEFISRQKVCHGTGFHLLHDGNIAIYRNLYSDTIVSIYNKSNSLHSYTEMKKRPNILLKNGGEIAEYNDTLYFINPLDYNIYKCKDTGYSPLLCFDFGNKNISADIQSEQNLHKIMKSIRENKKIFYFECLNIRKDFVFFRLSNGTFISHDRNENKTYVFNRLKYPYSSLLSASIYTTDNGRFAGFVSVGNIRNSLRPMFNLKKYDYSFLKTLQDSNIESYMENDWIVIGHFNDAIKSLAQQ